MKKSKGVKYKIVRPDAKGRITLGKVAEGVSSYIISTDNNDRIILEPQVEIPAQEKWLYDNKKALYQVRKGLKESADGQLEDLGSFAQFIENDE